MYKPFPLFVGLRYTSSQKKNHFVSFISLSSMLGISMGVMVLITVLSVMNGFDEEIHQRFFSMSPEITITSHSGVMTDWQNVTHDFQLIPEIKAFAPFVATQGLISFEGQVHPLLLTGIEPKLEDKITHLNSKLISGTTELNNFGILLGRGLADSLGVMIGDKVTVMIPKATVTMAGMEPRFKRFKVQGVFSAGSGFNFDSKLAFINIRDAQKLMQLQKNEVNGLKVKIDATYKAPMLANALHHKLEEKYIVGNWTETFGAFFHAVKMEKTMMFLILLLIIAVAAFNLVSSLVMVVNDKQAEIAILRTIGAGPRTILWIFIIQGMMVGIIGTLLGIILGVLLASNAAAIVNFLQSLLGTDILASSIYFVDYLPSKILIIDIIKISFASLLMSFLATIYPAWRASKTVIAEALHYE